MLLKLLYIFVILSLSGLSPCWSKEKEEVYWDQGTNVSLDLLKSNLSNETCYASKESLSLCINAIGSIMRWSDLDNHLLLIKDAPKSRNSIILTQKLVQDFKFFGVFEVTTEEAPEQISTHKYYTEGQLDKQDQVAFVGKVLEAIKEGQKKIGEGDKVRAQEFSDKFVMDFNKAAAAMIDKFVPREKRKMAIAKTYDYIRTQTVDPHTHIDPEKYFNESRASGDQTVIGIGAELKMIRGNVMIMRTLPGGGAGKAGIKANDFITHVDDHEITKKDSLDDIVQKIIGKEDTSVRITVKNASGTKSHTIVRAKVIKKNVELFVYQTLSGLRVGRVSLGSFMPENSCQQIYDGIERLEREEKAERIILDLRNNGGGLLSQANCIAGIFDGPNKLIVFQRDLQDFDKITSEEKSPPLNVAFGLPGVYSKQIIVLVDENSASASEIVAGYLRDKEKGIIVGRRTFGKGSVQNGVASVLPGADSGVLEFRTVGLYYFDTDWSPQLDGVGVDIKSFLDPLLSEEENFRMREKELFDLAIAPKGKKFQQSEARAKKIAELEKCLAEDGIALALYKKEKTSEEMLIDHQLYTALDVADCMVDKF